MSTIIYIDDGTTSYLEWQEKWSIPYPDITIWLRYPWPEVTTT